MRYVYNLRSSFSSVYITPLILIVKLNWSLVSHFVGFKDIPMAKSKITIWFQMGEESTIWNLFRNRENKGSMKNISIRKMMELEDYSKGNQSKPPFHWVSVPDILRPRYRVQTWYAEYYHSSIFEEERINAWRSCKTSTTAPLERQSSS